MLRKLLSNAKGYRICALLSPLLILVEVILEVRIPFVMAEMVDAGITGMKTQQAHHFRL